jgi:hypothetical protein
MSHVTMERRQEIDRNWERFLELLPGLKAAHEGQFALLRHGEIVGFFGSAIDAQIAGNQRFEDGIFSFQIVSEELEELGFHSYALHQG